MVDLSLVWFVRFGVCLEGLGVKGEGFRWFLGEAVEGGDFRVGVRSKFGV